MQYNIQEKKVIILQSQIETAHKPLLVIADDYTNYWLKISTFSEIPYDIFNEFICSFLLRLWEIPTPEVTILKISDILMKNNPNFKINSKFQEYNFGSQSIVESIDATDLFRANKKKFLSNINSLDLLLKIGLFDIWVGNDDRKPTNFNLLFAKNTFFAIDHAYTFCSMNYSDLKEDNYDFSIEDSILSSDISKDLCKELSEKNKNYLQELNIYYQKSIEKCKNEYSSIIKSIDKKALLDSTNVQLLNNFLFSDNRNKKVFEIFVEFIK